MLFLTCRCEPICTYTKNIMFLIKEFRIGPVIGPRFAVWPELEDRGPI